MTPIGLANDSNSMAGDSQQCTSLCQDPSSGTVAEGSLRLCDGILPGFGDPGAPFAPPQIQGESGPGVAISCCLENVVIFSRREEGE